MFSEHVVESGTELFKHFIKLRQFTQDFFKRHFEAPSTLQPNKDLGSELTFLKQMLGRFDELWTIYEHKYVSELMIIENDARRFVIESI